MSCQPFGICYGFGTHLLGVNFQFQMLTNGLRVAFHVRHQ
jgi:hypothetical protein